MNRDLYNKLEGYCFGCFVGVFGSTFSWAFLKKITWLHFFYTISMILIFIILSLYLLKKIGVKENE